MPRVDVFGALKIDGATRDERCATRQRRCDRCMRRRCRVALPTACSRLSGPVALPTACSRLQGLGRQEFLLRHDSATQARRGSRRCQAGAGAARRSTRAAEEQPAAQEEDIRVMCFVRGSRRVCCEFEYRVSYSCRVTTTRLTHARHDGRWRTEAERPTALNDAEPARPSLGARMPSQHRARGPTLVLDTPPRARLGRERMTRPLC